jgi:hypothetical protein
MVMYISFMGFKKFQISSQNPNVLAFRFTKKCQFTAKTDRISVFLGHKANMIVFQILDQNSKVSAFSFTENSSLCEKLNETPYFLVVKLIFQIGYT